MRWVAHGACRAIDPDLFFPQAASETVALEIAMAKAVCSRCAVAAACLEWAMATDQAEGIWGGLTRRERLSRARSA